jgi:hypothetical protein
MNFNIFSEVLLNTKFNEYFVTNIKVLSIRLTIRVWHQCFFLVATILKKRKSLPNYFF